MKLLIEKGVKEYLLKCNSQSIIVGALLEETSSGCCCGITKKYYTPYIRVRQSSKPISDEYIEYKVDGIDIFISEKVLADVEDVVTIYLEKALLMKKLNIKGLKVSMK